MMENDMSRRKELRLTLAAVSLGLLGGCVPADGLSGKICDHQLGREKDAGGKRHSGLHLGAAFR